MATTFPKRKSALKALAKTLTVSELRLAVQVFEEVATRIEEQERRAEIKALQKRMAEIGVTPSDLVTPKGRATSKIASSSKASKVPPKYRLEVDGDIHQWSGRGRRPRPFQEFIENGGDIETLLIGASARRKKTDGETKAATKKAAPKRKTAPKRKRARSTK